MGVGFLQFLEQGLGLVGALLIDHDDFERCIVVLVEQLWQACANVCTMVVDGDDDGKLRHGFDFLAANVSSMDLKIRIPRKTCTGLRTA